MIHSVQSSLQSYFVDVIKHLQLFVFIKKFHKIYIFQNPVDVTDTAEYLTAEEYILLERNQNRFSSRQSWEYLEYNGDDDILDDVTILFKDGRNEIEFNSSLSTKVQFVLEKELLLLLFLLL